MCRTGNRSEEREQELLDMQFNLAHLLNQQVGGELQAMSCDEPAAAGASGTLSRCSEAAKEPTSRNAEFVAVSSEKQLAQSKGESNVGSGRDPLEQAGDDAAATMSGHLLRTSRAVKRPLGQSSGGTSQTYGGEEEADAATNSKPLPQSGKGGEQRKERSSPQPARAAPPKGCFRGCMSFL